MSREHQYRMSVRWTGSLGSGTSAYNAYSRNHEISAPGKPALPGSSDPHFRGDPSRYNPEELLVASLSACHMLWFLHLCSDAGIVVTAYVDNPHGVMVEEADGAGQFRSVTLRPEVTMADPTRHAETGPLHHRAHKLCYIARSVNFPVFCEPTVTEGAA